jgi:hypothetical protein
MQTRREAAALRGAGSSQGGTSSDATESEKNHVRISVPAVSEREQQAITPDVPFHTMMRDMQQRMDSMATVIGTLNVELTTVARHLSILLLGLRLRSHRQVGLRL